MAIVLAQPCTPVPLPRRILPTRPGGCAVEYGSDPRLLKQARRWAWTASRLPRDQADPVVSIVDELFSNSLRHTASGLSHGTTWLEIAPYADRIYIAVTDRGTPPGCPSGEPRLLTADDDGVPSGFGLHLVDRLAVAWGWFGGSQCHTVWAEVVRPATGQKTLCVAEARRLTQARGRRKENL
ncbi:ATP-binding protein [Nocardiopsis sp. EMB25]|uniref:ATP-binding protein n=1 Tax=Nocardiopsis sp. EMB25 TaxID=2835867 RepID=UPI003FA345F7